MPRYGTIALIGSGELSDAMAEVHRQLMSRLGEPVKPVFVDSLAGFELNIDSIDQKAVSYFRRNFGQDLNLACYRTSRASAEQIAAAVSAIQQANYIFAGPGSPSYGLRIWRGSRVWEAILKRWREGAMLVFASAAAITLGALTLPVYEIYKVGDDPYWLPGLNMLDEIGLNAAVIPHWNNKSGDQHDTRFCFMGAPRFADLEHLLAPGTTILGIEEYTALVIESTQRRAEVLGAGQVTLRVADQQFTVSKGQPFDLDHPSMREAASAEPLPEPLAPVVAEDSATDADILGLQTTIDAAIESRDLHAAIEGLFALSLVAGAGLEQSIFNRATAAIQLLQTLIPQVHRLEFDSGADAHSKAERDALLDLIVEARTTLRTAKLWAAADTLRDRLIALNYTLSDTPQGTLVQHQD